MFTKTFSKLLEINCRSLTLLQRLDPALTCASRQNNLNYFQRSSKYLCTSTIEHENLVHSKQYNLRLDYPFFFTARQILTNLEDYSNNLSLPLKLRDDIEIEDINQFLAKSWISMSNAELLENFEILSNFAKRNEENLMNLQYGGLLEVIQNRCSDFSDDELYHLLKCLELWLLDKDAKFLKFWSYIDKECLDRFRKWSIDKVLLFNDQFYNLKLTRNSEFTYHSMKKLGYKPEKFSKINLIHYAFLLNINRKFFINLYNHEYYIERHIDELSLEELGFFAAAIIYHSSVIRSNEFIKKIIRKIKTDINIVSEFALGRNLQILRAISSDEELISELKSLLELLETQISTRDLPVLGYIADLQQRTLLHNPNLTEKILDRLEKDVKKATAKNLYYITLALNKFGYDSKDCKFYSTVINELLSPERAEEIEKYQKIFLKIVSNVHQVNFYSEDALKIVLDPEFLDKYSRGDKYNLSLDFLLLDFIIELEHPEYNGPRIEKDLLKYLIKRFGALRMENIYRNQKKHRTQQMITDIIEACKQAFNSESAACADPLLPHFAKLDIVICKDPQGNIISPEDKLSQIPNGTIKYAPKDGNKWYALVVSSFSSLTRENFKPTGSLVLELKHLKLLGYTPILVPYNEWEHLSGDDERQKYIKEILER